MVADEERRMISKRTKEALAAATARPLQRSHSHTSPDLRISAQYYCWITLNSCLVIS